MSDFAQVYDSLALVFDLLNIDGEGRLALDDPLLPGAARKLRLSTEKCCAGSQIPAHAMAFQECVDRVVLSADGSELVTRLEAFVSEFLACLKTVPMVRMWTLARQLKLVEQAIAKFFERKSESEAQNFARVLSSSSWAEDTVARLSLEYGAFKSHQLRVDSAPSFAAAAYWMEILEREDTPRLANLLTGATYPLEVRARDCWMESIKGEPTLGSVYVRAWTDVLPLLQPSLSRNWLVGVMEQCAEMCNELRLPEVAQYLDDPDFLMSYGLQWLLPPDPAQVRVQSLGNFRRLLDGQLSRWYYRPFGSAIAAPEIAAGVLNAGRPLLYERVLAHALLQYGILLLLPPGDGHDGFYLDLMAMAEQNFETLLDGYLLGQSFTRELKTPAAWKKYLESVICVHANSGASCVRLKNRFLAERGLSSGREILSRLSSRLIKVH